MIWKCRRPQSKFPCSVNDIRKTLEPRAETIKGIEICQESSRIGREREAEVASSRELIG